MSTDDWLMEIEAAAIAFIENRGVDVAVIGDNDKAEPSSITVTSTPRFSINAKAAASISSMVDNEPFTIGVSKASRLPSSAPLRPISMVSSPSKSSTTSGTISLDFDDWLSSVTLDELDFQSKEIVPEVVDDFDGELTIEKIGRKSAEDGKRLAFDTPMVKGLEFVYQRCNHLCPLGGKCTFPISGKSLYMLL